MFEGPCDDTGLNDYEFLWMRVLYQALHDADNLDNSNITKRNQAKQAIIWLVREYEDFEMVCLAAQQDPDWFRGRAIQWLKARYKPQLLRSVFASRRK